MWVQRKTKRTALQTEPKTVVSWLRQKIRQQQKAVQLLENSKGLQNWKSYYHLWFCVTDKFHVRYDGFRAIRVVFDGDESYFTLCFVALSRNGFPSKLCIFHGFRLTISFVSNPTVSWTKRTQGQKVAFDSAANNQTDLFIIFLRSQSEHDSHIATEKGGIGETLL